MAGSSLEERVSELEREVRLLKETQLSKSKDGWRRIVGSFAGCPDFDEAMELGRQYRESLRSAEEDA